MIQAIQWQDDHLVLLDQTRLPEETRWLTLHESEGVYRAIQQLQVRGAPAIGIAAAYGLYLGVRARRPDTRQAFLEALREQVRFLASARPTAVNLAWALESVAQTLEASPEQDPNALLAQLLEQARALHEDDRRRCEAIATHGQALVPDGARVLTHCHTGMLATGGLGTALGILHKAHALGKRLEVYADETRPLLQGARLTMWELMTAGIPAFLICDNMAAALMQQRRVDLVLVGADRIAADGAVANKIGTYGLAVLARHHGLPFYVAAPLSTVDLQTARGEDIPIETRAEDEVRCIWGRLAVAPAKARCWNPAFDVSPAELVTAIVTEVGVVRPPYAEGLREAVSRARASGSRLLPKGAS